MRRAASVASDASVAQERPGPVATRHALVDAATELFAQHGFDGVATDQLAARAGVNKALISYHFGGKRGLYVAALAKVFGELSARVKAVEAEGLGVRETVHGLVQAFAALWRERPDFPGLWLRELLSNGIDPSLVPQLVEIAGVTRRLALRGAREGVFRPVDPLLFHFALIGSVIFFLATEPARRRAASSGQLPLTMPDALDFFRYVEELTLRGLAPTSGARPRRARAAASRSPRQRKGARA